MHNKYVPYGVLLVAIVALGLLVRVWLYQQPVNSDDVGYFVYARNYLDTSCPGPAMGHTSANALRISFLIPVRVYQYIFDYSLSAYYAAIYGSAILSFLAVLFFSLTVSSRGATVVALLLWGTSYVSILTDTRLLPDNFGTAMSLFALTALVRAGGFGAGHNSATERSGHTGLLSNSVAAFIGGLLLWVAWSARANFAVFAVPAVLVVLLSTNRWQLLGAFMGGLAAGAAFEMLILALDYGDPLFRLKLLLGYGSKPRPRAFQGYMLSDLFTRYPRLLSQTGSAEIMIFAFGLLGALVWAVRWRNQLSLIKFTALTASYGFIAFAITRFDPPVPLMREKLRYYATAAPFFYIATSELIIMISSRLRPNTPFRKIERDAGRWRRLGRSSMIVFPPLVIASFAVFVGCKNLLVTSGCTNLARNGNDNFFAAVKAIRSHAKDDGLPRRIYDDFRSARVLGILLPSRENWQLVDYSSRSGGGGYLFADWRRLNSNVKHDYVHAPETYTFFRSIENMPLLLRHRHGSYLTDVFVVPEESFHRDIADVTDRLPPGWTGWETRETGPRVLSHSDRFEVGPKGWVYSGTDAPWRPPSVSGALPGDHFIEVLLDTYSKEISGLIGYLYYWREGDKLPQKQYLGRVYVDQEVRSVALWTYLPQSARSFRVVFRGVSGTPLNVRIGKLLMLERTAHDTVKQQGGPW